MAEAPRVHVESTADSQMGTNSYLVQDEASGDAVIIDANLEPELMVELARRRRARVRAILLTHTDIDHIAGLPALLAEDRPLRPEYPMGIGKLEAELQSLQEGTPYRAGSLEFEVIHTPGHSPGGVTLAIEGMLFTGDALFAGSVGRSDLAHGDHRALVEGIQSRLMARPDQVLVFSGHGPMTTIGQERRYNPFL